MYLFKLLFTAKPNRGKETDVVEEQRWIFPPLPVAVRNSMKAMDHEEKQFPT